MLFRYRCRNYPDLLAEEESQRWRTILPRETIGRAKRMEGSRVKDKLMKLSIEKRNDANPQQALLLEQLSQYIRALCAES